MARRTNQKPSGASELRECPVCLDFLPHSGGLCLVCGHLPHPKARTVCPPAMDLPRSIPPNRDPNIAPYALPDKVPFVGRETELKLLSNLLVSSTPPYPKLVWIEGPRGIGKKSLVREALGRLQNPPITIIWTTQHHGAMVTYGPIHHWLRSIPELSETAGDGEINRNIESYTNKVAGIQAAEAVYLQVLLGTSTGRDLVGQLPPEHVRRNLHRVIGQLIAGQAHEQDLCLIVDNIQWLDHATISFLDDALQGLVTAPLTIIALADGSGFGWTPVKAPDTTIRLGALPENEREELFDTIVPAVEFLPELRQRVIDQQIGTPLFLEELARLVRQIILINSGPVRPDQSAHIIDILPQSLPELIQCRIDLLNRRGNLLLRLAAVLGPDCSLGLFECFDQIKEDLHDQLHALEGVEILKRHEGFKDPRFHFIEEHVRDLAYESMPREQRLVLHRQVADVLERIHAGQQGEHYEQLAWHYGKAENPEKAAYYQIKVADRQYQLGAVDQALESYAQAFELLKALEPTPEHQARMARILILQGRILRYKSQLETSTAMLEAALQLGEELSNPYLINYARLEIVLTILEQGKSAEARKKLRQLREDIGWLEHPAAECVILNALGVIHLQAGEYDMALEYFHELGIKSSTAELKHLEADALNNTGLIYWRWSRYAEAGKAFRGAAAIRMSMADQFGLIAALMNMGILQEQIGEIKPAFDNLREALALAIQTGFARGQALLEINLANITRRMGRTMESVDHAARAVELARRLGDNGAEWAALDNLGQACAEAGRGDEALEHLRRAVEIVHGCGSEEEQIQAELDLLDVASQGRRVTQQLLLEAEEIVKKVEAHGWRELLPQAFRVKGRLLHLLESKDNPNSRIFLQRSLDHAASSNNIFEQLASLRELVACAGESGGGEEIQQWRTLTRRIEKLVRVTNGVD